MANRKSPAWAILVLPLFLTACAKEEASSSDGSASDASITSCLVGEWDASISNQGISGSDSGNITTFNADGTGSYDPSSGATQTFSWSVSSGLLTVLFDAVVSRDGIGGPSKFPVTCTSDGASTLLLEGGDVDTLLGDWTTVSPIQAFATENSTSPALQLDFAISFNDSGSAKTGSYLNTGSEDKDSDGTFEDLDNTDPADEVTAASFNFTWSADLVARVITTTADGESTSDSMSYIIDGSHLGIMAFSKHVAASSARSVR
jgi:hypothetical protein